MNVTIYTLNNWLLFFILLTNIKVYVRDHDHRCSVGLRCRAYMFPVVKNVPVDDSAYAQ